MKIAIFTNNYLPNPYGVSMSIESFRKEFEKLGHTVYIFAPEFENHIDENKNVYRFPSINFTFKKINFPLAIPYSYRINMILNELEIDVVHCQHPNLLGWAGKRWAKKKNAPLIFTWHTLYDQYAHFAKGIVPEKIAAWWTIRNAVNFANSAYQVITPTLSVAKIIKWWGVTNENISDIPTGIDENVFKNANGKSIRKKYDIADDEILLVLVSRFTAEKNAEFLIKSVIFALKKNKKIKFLAGGDGYLLDSLKELIEKEGVADQVIFPGFIGNDVKKNYYDAGDIFVFASKSETQGMIISEALYMGLPVVAVSATGVKDLVTNQVDGLLVGENEEDFANAISRLVSDGELRKKFSDNGKRIAKRQYTSSVCAGKMLEIYQKAIQKKNKERK
ncbi:MAG: glycosyl transferase, group 1 [uncultured bacterium]|nr:MAG: glycosyl transferase, group 1 [uncultured bacterium]